MDRIYLDHAATAPVRAEVADAMAAALRAPAGNASSVHAAGRAARAAVEAARREVAALAGVAPEEIVFTSGGTEGNNLVVRGLARGAAARLAPGARPHVVSSRLEHPSVLGDKAVAVFRHSDSTGPGCANPEPPASSRVNVTARNSRRQAIICVGLGQGGTASLAIFAAIVPPAN